MELIGILEQRIDTIGREVMALVENQGISLTQKNQKMKPLIDEKQVLERAVAELNAIKSTDYSGRCSG